MTSVLAPEIPPAGDPSGASALPRHAKRPIGATLLSNWVEERACCALGLDDQPVSRAHADLLVHSPPGPCYETTQQAMSAPVSAAHAAALQQQVQHKTVPSAGRGGGKRRQQRDAELLLEAVAEAASAAKRQEEEGNVSRGAAQWKSTCKSDFGHEDVYGKVEDLGARPPSEEDSRRFETPITFWSDFAVKGSGTTVSSLKADPHHHPRSHGGFSYEWRGDEQPRRISGPVGHRAGQARQHDASGAGVRFGRHAEFSTPIGEYAKGAVKDL
ncbi:hypothetical protein BDZ88DRAFT_169043 [Geranomyces variabilis]|nr:hypothetical protein BDZ88DRAFT_169043 [Geranomyces variabilis]KAJ3135099.1 hypothetical protein HDU90_004130 [Geranomyces variabilis]